MSAPEARIKRIDTYRPIFETEKRYIRLQGGAGSGKSIAVAQYLLLTSMSEPGHRIFAFRKVKVTTKFSIFATFKDLISENEWGKYFDINLTYQSFTCKATGVEIICGGIDDPEKIKSIKDPTIIWCEEATEFTRGDIDQLNLRLRKLGIKNQLILSYNPIDKRNWMYHALHIIQEWGNKELYIQSTYKDNPFLPDDYIEHLESLQTKNEKAYLVYTKGEWADMKEGLIFSKYEIIDEFPEHLIQRSWYGLDFGYNDPTAMVRVAIEDNILYVDELFYEREQTIDDLLLYLPGMGVEGTDTIFCDSASPGSIESLYRKGYRRAVPCVKGKDSVLAGITKVKEYIMKVTSISVNLIDELDSYVWQQDKHGKYVESPTDGNDHCIDAMRYAVYSKTFQPGGGKKMAPPLRPQRPKPRRL